MNEPSLPPTLACVLSLRLAEFAGKPVPEQARLRAQFEAVAQEGLAGLQSAQRVVLEAADGLAIVVLDHPAGALDAAECCLRAGSALPLSVGLNHGPVAVVAADEAGGGLVGDGIAAAVSAAEFAAPGTLLATRAFREALAARAPARDALLRPAGLFADAGLRTHELYAPDPRGAAPRRRRLLAATAGVLLLLLLAALGLRGAGLFVKPAVLSFDITPGGEIFVDGRARGTTPPVKTLELRPGSYSVEVRHGMHPPMQIDVQLEPGQQALIRHHFAPPGELLFELTPGSKVYVDGAYRGSAPELRRLELLAGRYRLRLTHEGYADVERTLEIRSGQRQVIRHEFASAKPLDKPKQLLRDWRRKLGFD